MKTRILPFLTALLCLLPSLALPLSALSVSAQASVLLECSRGDVVYAMNETERLPMASTTKIMTALVALENGDLARSYAIPAEAVGVEGSSVYLKAGEHLTLEELLYAVMLESANDAATAVALLVGGSMDGFAAMMNEKCAKLGLSDTHFTNPHGLDDAEHYTTALDLARLAAYALENPVFAAMVSTERKTIPLNDGEGTRVLVNHNRLLRMYDDVIGVKTGFTKRSGRCLVSAAERDGVRMVSVTLNAPDDWRDHRALLDYGFSLYECVRLAEPGEYTVELPCAGAENGFLTAANADGLSMVLPAGTQFTVQTESRGLWFAPVEEGQVVGVIHFLADGKELASLPLTAVRAVTIPERKPGFFEKIWKY